MLKKQAFLFVFCLFFLMPSISEAASLPDYVININSENTAQNDDDILAIKPSKLTQELLDTSSEKIQNMQLIRLLNESTINKSSFAFGNRATIFLGEWPLNYRSEKQTINWQYQKINTNIYDNNAGSQVAKINYVQQSHKTISSSLTTKISNADEVQKMIVQEARKKSKLPITLETSIGTGTKMQRNYEIQPKEIGQLDTFVPAVIEKGEVVFGEVYLVIKGSKKSIVIKNATSQQIGAFIPIQDHISMIFTVK